MMKGSRQASPLPCPQQQVCHWDEDGVLNYINWLQWLPQAPAEDIPRRDSPSSPCLAMRHAHNSWRAFHSAACLACTASPAVLNIAPITITVRRHLFTFQQSCMQWDDVFSCGLLLVTPTTVRVECICSYSIPKSPLPDTAAHCVRSCPRTY